MTDHALYYVEVNFQNRGQSTFRTKYRSPHDIVDDCLNSEVCEFYDPIAETTTAFRSKDVLALIVKEIKENATNQE